MIMRMEGHERKMTLEERIAFLEENKKWLGDFTFAVGGQGSFYDNMEGLQVSDETVFKTLAERKKKNQPWKPPAK